MGCLNHACAGDKYAPGHYEKHRTLNWSTSSPRFMIPIRTISRERKGRVAISTATPSSRRDATSSENRWMPSGPSRGRLIEQEQRCIARNRHRDADLSHPLRVIAHRPLRILRKSGSQERCPQCCFISRCAASKCRKIRKILDTREVWVEHHILGDIGEMSLGLERIVLFSSPLILALPEVGSIKPRKS